jgi:hypothetical protein
MLLLVLPSCSSYLQVCYNGLPTPHTPHTPSSSPSQPPAITIYHHHRHPHCYYRFHHTQVHVCTVYLVIHLVFLYIQKNIWYMFAVFPSFIHIYIYGYLPSIHMKASRPNACKCNVNLFRFVIVLFSKVVRQWGICNIFFYIIYSIYDIILSASSTHL